jgi:hypothetical protein
MAQLPLSAVAPATGGWGALGALVGLAAGWFFHLGAFVSWLLLLVLAATPMWLCEWRERPEGAHAASVTSRQSLLGVATVALLFLCSMQIQMLLGSGKGQGVSLFMIPVLAAFAAMAMVALLRPALLSPTVAACGGLVTAVLKGKRPDSDQVLALMGWLVKAVFLPLMLAWSFTWIAGAADVWHERSGLAMFAVAMALLYAVDTAFATVGYMSTSERIDGQIRSVERTVLGWLSALACYPPLSVLILDTWLVYKTGSDWTAWFSSGTPWAWLWGGAILVLTAVYTWSSVVFGPRFSNLTNRGIITSGPYRWGKHPAYLCKNLSWWLIYVPFLGNQTPIEALLHCLALLGVNAIYALRAWTEERHLNTDPDYRAYALWISTHGLVARAGRLIRRPTPAE